MADDAALVNQAPDAATGTPESAPIRRNGFADPEKARAAQAKGAAMRKAKAEKKKARAAASSQGEAPAPEAQRPIDRVAAVTSALALTAELTGDSRYLAVASAHAPAMADVAQDMATAYGVTLDVDPRVTASISAAVVAFSCYQTFAAAERKPVTPAQQPSAPAPPPAQPSAPEGATVTAIFGGAGG